MPAPPMPDAGTQQLLENAYADAHAQLKGQVPDSLLHSVPRNTGPDNSSLSISRSGGALQAAAPPPPVDAPPEGAQSYGVDDFGTPPKGAEPAKAEKPGWGGTVGKAWMRGSLTLANVLGFATAGVLKGVGTIAETAGVAPEGTGDAAADSVFDFLRDHVDTAKEHWAASQNETTGQKIAGGVVENLTPLLLGPAASVPAFATGAGVDAAKQSIDEGQDLTTAETLALIHGASAALLPKSVPHLPGFFKRAAAAIGAGEAINQATERLTKKILADRGYQEAADKIDPLDPTQLSVNALMQAIFAATTRVAPRKATSPGAKPSGEPDILKPGQEGQEPPPPGAPPAPASPAPSDVAPTPGAPAGTTAPSAPPAEASANEPATAGFQGGERVILNAPSGPRAVVVAGPAGADGKVPVHMVGDDGSISKNTLAVDPAILQGTPKAPKKAKAEKAPAVPDQPSAEPSADLHAQVADMNDPATPRKGVYLSPDNVASIGKEGVKKLANGKPVTNNFDGKGGVMIFADVGERVKAGKARKADGADMQGIIGKLTGAGEGKAPDQTVVVQGHTPEGAVATESMVHPDEVPAKVEAVAAEGKTPVVTTPVEAQIRREQGVAAEQAAAPEQSATQVGLQDLAGKAVKRIAMEQAARENLDGIFERGDTVKDVATQFWKRTYFKLPPEVQARFRSMLGEHIGSRDTSGDLSKMTDRIDLPDSVEHLEGTDRGFVALMDEANRRTPVEKSGGKKKLAVGKDLKAPEVPLAADEAAADLERTKAALHKLSQEGEEGTPKAHTGLDEEDRDALKQEGYSPTEIGVLDRNPELGRKHVALLEKGMTREQAIAELTGKKSGKTHEPVEHPKAEAAKEVSKAAEPAPEPKAEAPKPATVQTKGEVIPRLDEAATDLKASEAEVAKKKVKGGLTERVRQVSAFAQVLKEAALHASLNGTADEAAIERAADAANKARKLGDKSTEEISKGQGVGHAELDAHAKELLAAAEQLQGREAEVKAPEDNVRVTKLKARIEKAKAQVKAERAAAEPVVDTGETVSTSSGDRKLSDVVADAKRMGVKPTFADIGAKLEVESKDRQRVADAIKKAAEKRGTAKAVKDVGKEKSAIPDVVDEVAAAKKKAEETGPLRELGKDLKRRLQRALDTYLDSGHGAREHYRSEFEKAAHEIYEPQTPGEREALTHLLESADNQWDDRHGARPQEIEGPEEQHVKGIDYSDPDAADRFSDRPDDMSLRDTPSASWAHDMWSNLHGKLVESGLYNAMRRAMHENRTISSHKLLDHILTQLKPGEPLHDLLSKIRDHVPDHDVRAVHKVRLTDGSHSDVAAGRFDSKNGVQLRLRDNELSPRTLITMVHELVHGATSKFMHDNPDHPLTQEIGRLRDIAEQRMRDLHGDEVVDRALAQLRGRIQMPALGSPDYNVMRSLYGLRDPHEFMTESLTRPSWQKKLADSELFAKPGDKIPETITSKIMRAVTRMLGIKRPDTARLLSATAHITGRIMEEQANQRAGVRPATVEQAYESLRAPHRLINEDKIRAVAGDRMTRMASDWYSSVRKGVPGVLRSKVNALKSFDQLMRTGAQWFGHHNDPMNVVHQYAEASTAGAEHTNEITNRAQPLVERWTRLTRAENKQLGEFMKDSTIWGIDPTVAADKHAKVTQAGKKFEARYDEFQRRWDNMTDEQKSVYEDVRDFNEWAARKNRNAGIEAALHAYSDTEVPKAMRQLLYSVRHPGEYEGIVGEGKLIDVGDRNAALVKSLETLAGLNQHEGPYFHLGRHGDHVVQIESEGKRDFKTKAEAEQFAEQVGDLSPKSEGLVSQNPDGTHRVEYNIDYVSMHEKASHAEAEAQMLRDRGFDVGNVTKKIMSRESAPLAAGAEQLVSEMSRRLNRDKSGESEPLIDALRSSFVQMMAARSSYAGSKLMRKGTAGVKGEEMLRSFAGHTQSLAWHTGQLSSVFAKGEALGKIREATKQSKGIDQNTSYHRGEILNEINARLKQEVSQHGLSSPFNSAIAKLGYMNFLASPAHAYIWMTQNFTTAIPVAGARWGYAKSAAAFGRAMWTVGGPAFRETVLAHIKPGEHTASDILNAVVKAVQQDKHLGKWAQGENSHLKQIFDRGGISNSFASELGEMSKGTSPLVNRVMDYARLMPHLADVFNRVSTALAGLEMTNGDVAKSVDLVRETHMDYSAGNKSRAFKGISRVPGFSSVTMLRTYTQGMAHLLYSNIAHMVTGGAEGNGKSRAEAAKTVAGVIAATSILAGVTKGAILEPIRLAAYAYNKIFGDDDEFHDLDHTVDKALQEMLGHTAGLAVSRGVTNILPGGLAHDLSSRMGLSDLFFKDMPDLFSGSPKDPAEFAASLLGPMPRMVGDNIAAAVRHYQDGEPYQMIMSLLPLKALQDANKAVSLATTGKTNDKGAQLTEPSMASAALRAFGLKSTPEMEAQNRANVAYEMNDQMYARKKAIMRQVAQNGWGATYDTISKFNQMNPSYRITFSDYRRQMKSAANAEAIAAGRPTRNTQLNEELDY